MGALPSATQTCGGSIQQRGHASVQPVGSRQRPAEGFGDAGEGGVAVAEGLEVEPLGHVRLDGHVVAVNQDLCACVIVGHARTVGATRASASACTGATIVKGTRVSSTTCATDTLTCVGGWASPASPAQGQACKRLLLPPHRLTCGAAGLKQRSVPAMGAICADRDGQRRTETDRDGSWRAGLEEGEMDIWLT